MNKNDKLIKEFISEKIKNISGELAFNLMDTHGLPLDMMIDVLDDKNLSVMWGEFVDIALTRKWYSYQVYERIKNAYDESINFTRRKDEINSILNNVRYHICVVDEHYKHLIS